QFYKTIVMKRRLHKNNSHRHFATLLLPAFLLLCPLSSCSSDDLEEEITETPANNGIINAFTPSENVKAFFENEYPLKGQTAFFDGDQTWSDEQTAQELYPANLCYFVNSNEQLQTYYHGDVALPEIDFSKYTLLLGRKLTPHAETVESMVLTKAESGYDLVVNAIHTRPKDYAEFAMLQLSTFWALYPKLEEGNVNVTVNIRLVELD
ncbi:MAG: hypothetical protein IJ841_05055, partial [Prevotella sp.]|nr:hypothetical protein [Prevotella sp.]